MEITSVIIKPKVTEKTQNMKTFSDPQMSFVVNAKANKFQIANAFAALFGVVPKSVNVLKRKPTSTRFMNKTRHNYTKEEKIAYIKVSSSDFEELQKKSEDMLVSQSDSSSNSNEIMIDEVVSSESEKSQDVENNEKENSIKEEKK